MKIIKSLLITAIISLSASKVILAQDISEMKVKYMLSFDSIKDTYVAWVVPVYETPNSNNPDTEEKGVTAQFTIKVPKGSSISDIGNLKGTWESSPTKLGNSTYIKGLDDQYEYYVIGKTPNETNYGSFKENEPVALFTFKTKGITSSEKVMVLENDDAAIKVLTENYALNVAPSFYSKSGQKASVSARPREQFYSRVTLTEVLNENLKKISQEYSIGSGEIDLGSKLVVYPNPSKDVLNIKLLVTDSAEKVQVDILDLKGVVVRSKSIPAKLGYNALSIDVSDLTEGTYLMNSQIGGKVASRKFVKH